MNVYLTVTEEQRVFLARMVDVANHQVTHDHGELEMSDESGRALVLHLNMLRGLKKALASPGLQKP